MGKTSLIQWLASATGNHCVRINNHEHTDIQEYVGCYSSDSRGKLVFKEGENNRVLVPGRPGRGADLAAPFQAS